MSVEPTQSRKVFMAGHIYPPSGGRCTHERHLGPFRPRPDLDRWMASVGQAALPQYDCLSCGSSRGFTDAQVNREVA